MTWFIPSAAWRKVGYSLMIGGALALPAFGQAGGGAGASGSGSTGTSSSGSTGGAAAGSGATSAAGSATTSGSGTSGAANQSTRTSMPRDSSSTSNSLDNSSRAGTSNPYGQYDRGRYGDGRSYDNPYASQAGPTGQTQRGYDNSGRGVDSRYGSDRSYDAREGSRFDNSGRYGSSTDTYGNADNRDFRGRTDNMPRNDTRFDSRTSFRRGDDYSSPQSGSAVDSSRLRFDSRTGVYNDATTGRSYYYDSRSGQYRPSDRSATGTADTSARPRFDASRFSYDSSTGLYTDPGSGYSYQYDSTSGRYYLSDRNGAGTSTYGNVDSSPRGTYDTSGRYNTGASQIGQYDRSRYGSSRSYDNPYATGTRGGYGTTSSGADANVDYNYRSNTGFERSSGSATGSVYDRSGASPYGASSTYDTRYYNPGAGYTSGSTGYYDANGRWRPYSTSGAATDPTPRGYYDSDGRWRSYNSSDTGTYGNPDRNMNDNWRYRSYDNSTRYDYDRTP